MIENLTLKEKLPTVLVPELFRLTGGVQVFSRCLIEALDTIYGMPVPVFSRNDRREDCPSEFLRNRTFVGCGSLSTSLRRFKLMASCLVSRTPFWISTHPHFAPWLQHQQMLRKQPFVCVAHGIDVWNIKGSNVAKGLTNASCILPVSRFTADRLNNQLGEVIPPVSIFPNTFDDMRFYPRAPVVEWRERLKVPENFSMMLSVCRVSKGDVGKGYDKILEALPKLLKRNSKLVWVLGGKGDDLDRVKEKAKILGVADHCRFPGYIPDVELPDLYRSSDLFVLPSQKEGFGIVFLEAAACGLPVIAGNQDGSVDALAGGVLGTLIDPDSEEQLITGIERSLNSPKSDGEALHRQCVDLFGKRPFRGRLQNVLTDLGYL